MVFVTGVSVSATAIVFFSFFFLFFLMDTVGRVYVKMRQRTWLAGDGFSDYGLW